MDFSLFFNEILKFFQLFLHSPFFLALKFLLAIYVSVLFADLVMLLILRGFGDVRATFKGMNIPLVSPAKIRKSWNGIKLKLETGDTNQYKLAVIEADKIVDKIIGSMGLKGSDMIQRLENLKPKQIENAEDLKDAHRTRNQIIHDPSFQIDKEKTLEILGKYEKFLVEFEFME